MMPLLLAGRRTDVFQESLEQQQVKPANQFQFLPKITQSLKNFEIFEIRVKNLSNYRKKNIFMIFQQFFTNFLNEILPSIFCIALHIFLQNCKQSLRNVKIL